MRQREDMVEGVCDMLGPACVAPRRHSWGGWGVCRQGRG